MFKKLICYILLAASVQAADTGKIRILIFSGANNHSWKTTTPVLQKMYEESGRFVVTVTNDVPNLNPAEFAKYDGIVCNYTSYPVVDGHRWPAATEKAFLDYIAAGHGFVLFHAASTAWSDWPEFGDLIGLTWQKDKLTGKNISGHGRYRPFVVKVVDPEHPVTQGMKDFQHMPDELYHRQLLHPTGHVLATAHSDKPGGTNADEPMVVVTHLGKGRAFHCVMGHDPRPMAGVGFRTLMLRGTEWAMTGKVTIPIPPEWPTPGSAEGEAVKNLPVPTKAAAKPTPDVAKPH